MNVKLPNLLVQADCVINTAIDCKWEQIDKFDMSGVMAAFLDRELKPGDYRGAKKWEKHCKNNPQAAETVWTDWLQGDKGKDQFKGLTLKEATAFLPLPKPTPGVSLGTLKDGRPLTYVNSYTWFWTDPATFKPLSKKDSSKGAGANVWINVKATPVALEFNPGNGGTGSACYGPGTVGDTTRTAKQIRPWYDRSPSGCHYKYKKATRNGAQQSTPATLSIRWRISWEASNQMSGELPDYLTTTPVPLVVIEQHNLVVG